MREYGSEFEIEFARDCYFDNLCKLMPYTAFTRSGREAIGLIAHTIKSGVVLMPAYCCWSMELPFEQAGLRIEYYKLNKDLTVNQDFLIEQISTHKPAAVLVMNYFGFVPTHDVISLIKKVDENIIIIEDFTQSLFGLEDNFNPCVDAYVASIRKSVSVPDGGVVLTKLPIDTSLLKNGDTTLFVTEHIKAGKKKTQYRYTANTGDKQTFRELQSVAGKDIKEHYGLFHISEEAKSIIQHIIVENIKCARYHNYLNLYNYISQDPNLRILFPPSEKNKAPFMMIICVDKRNEFQSALAKEGVYAQVLWPLTETAKTICPNSKYMEEHMLAIPIDQRYFFDDIKEIAERINSISL